MWNDRSSISAPMIKCFHTITTLQLRIIPSAGPEARGRSSSIIRISPITSIVRASMSLNDDRLTGTLVSGTSLLIWVAWRRISKLWDRSDRVSSSSWMFPAVWSFGWAVTSPSHFYCTGFVVSMLILMLANASVVLSVLWIEEPYGKAHRFCTPVDQERCAQW